MTEADERRVRAIVQDEILGIIRDGEELLNLKKDPTGFGKKALEGLANLIRRRRPSSTDEHDNSTA